MHLNSSNRWIRACWFRFRSYL